MQKTEIKYALIKNQFAPCYIPTKSKTEAARRPSAECVAVVVPGLVWLGQVGLHSKNKEISSYSEIYCMPETKYSL